MSSTSFSIDEGGPICRNERQMKTDTKFELGTFVIISSYITTYFKNLKLIGNDEFNNLIYIITSPHYPSKIYWLHGFWLNMAI
jgi:hypothetical protein